MIKYKLLFKHLRRFWSLFWERRFSNFWINIWNSFLEPMVGAIGIILLTSLAIVIVGAVFLSLTIFTYSWMNFSDDFNSQNFVGAATIPMMVFAIGGLAAIGIWHIYTWLAGELRYCWHETSARGLAKRYLL